MQADPPLAREALYWRITRAAIVAPDELVSLLDAWGFAKRPGKNLCWFFTHAQFGLTVSVPLTSPVHAEYRNRVIAEIDRLCVMSGITLGGFDDE